MYQMISGKLYSAGDQGNLIIPKNDKFIIIKNKDNEYCLFSSSYISDNELEPIIIKNLMAKTDVTYQICDRQCY
jgi:hypothetical protein